MSALKFIVEANKRQVRRLLGWTELQYAEFVEAKAKEYLKNVLFADEAAINELLKGKLWWNWWKNHWNRRDEEFVTYSEIYHQHLLEFEYVRLNSIKGGIYPHSRIMDETYAILMDAINKEAVKANQASLV